jgi:flagellar protein FlaG
MSIQSISGNALSSVAAPIANPRQAIPESANATSASQSAVAATVTQQAPTPAREVQSNRQMLDEAVKTVNDFVKTVNNSLQFSIDDDTGVTVVKVIDSATKEVIKQIPSKEMLELAKALDSIKGLLVHQKA